MAGDDGVIDSSKSIENLEENLRGNPDEIGSTIHLAWALYGEANYEEALTTLQDARTRYPDDYEIAYVMGLILKKLGNMDEARKVFRDVIRLSEEIADETRAHMLRRFALGHVNMIDNGDWNFKAAVK